MARHDPAVNSEVQAQVRTKMSNVIEDRKLRRHLDHLLVLRKKMAADMERQKGTMRKRLGQYRADKAVAREQKEVMRYNVDPLSGRFLWNEDIPSLEKSDLDMMFGGDVTIKGRESHKATLRRPKSASDKPLSSQNRYSPVKGKRHLSVDQLNVCSSLPRSKSCEQVGPTTSKDSGDTGKIHDKMVSTSSTSTTSSDESGGDIYDSYPHTGRQCSLIPEARTGNFPDPLNRPCSALSVGPRLSLPKSGKRSRSLSLSPSPRRASLIFSFEELSELMPDRTRSSSQFNLTKADALDNLVFSPSDAHLDFVRYALSDTPRPVTPGRIAKFLPPDPPSGQSSDENDEDDEIDDPIDSTKQTTTLQTLQPRRHRRSNTASGRLEVSGSPRLLPARSHAGTGSNGGNGDVIDTEFDEVFPLEPQSEEAPSNRTLLPAIVIQCPTPQPD